jgi:4-hydroxybenzoate polyprenyltransferase
LLKKVAAFFKLIRYKNLFFIVLAQCLLQFCIIQPLYYEVNLVPAIDGLHFVLIVIASICIAAAGNVINDYFDINIDLINKPNKLVVNKIISRRWVIFWHLALNLIGLVCTMYVSLKIGMSSLFIANAVCVLLLFIYSASLKKRLLWGNILVSLLTAWVLMILIIPEYNFFTKQSIEQSAANEKMLRLGILYAGFSFIISLVREVVKDVEDFEGDVKYGCKTMPIVWGINASKIFAGIFIIILAIILLVIQIYVVRFGWWVSICYCIIFVITPLFIVFKKLLIAQSKDDFGKLSIYIKLVMLTGILSMIFIKWYH